MKTVNVALIGYKFMGRAHSNAWRQAASFFDAPVAPVLKVVCGRDEAGVRDVAARFGWREHSTDWEEAARRDDIDVVDICTPGDTHLPVALAAAEAGLRGRRAGVEDSGRRRARRAFAHLGERLGGGGS